MKRTCCLATSKRMIIMSATWSSILPLKNKLLEYETNMLPRYIQENDNNVSNMEFHTTLKKQIIRV
jgi:hypothetical protein